MTSDESKIRVPSDYEPSESTQKKGFRDDRQKKKIEFKKVGTLPKGNYWYKYMSLEAALLSLETGYLRFVEPSSWEDEYESRFYNANYKNITKDKETTPKLYACCMTSKRENEAAWSIYSHKAKGLAARCVRFRIHRSDFRLALVKSDTLDHCKIYIGAVEYKNRWVIDNIHIKEVKTKKGNTIGTEYEKYFDNFSLDNYINLLLLKRREFDHESEVRLFIIKNEEAQKKKFLPKKDKTNSSKDKADSIDVKLDWKDIIEGVDIDKNCSEYEKVLLVRALANLHGEEPDKIDIKNYKDQYEHYMIREINVYESDNSAEPIEIQ